MDTVMQLVWSRVYRHRGEIISKAQAIELWIEHTREPLGPLVNVFSTVYDDAIHHSYVRDRLGVAGIQVTFLAVRKMKDLMFPTKIQSTRYGTFQLCMLNDLVLVQRLRRETTNSGLLIVKSLQYMQFGTVIGIGPHCRAVNVGDDVCFLERTGQPMFYADDRFEQTAQERDLLVMHEAHILGVVESW